MGGISLKHLSFLTNDVPPSRKWEWFLNFIYMPSIDVQIKGPPVVSFAHCFLLLQVKVVNNLALFWTPTHSKITSRLNGNRNKEISREFHVIGAGKAELFKCMVLKLCSWRRCFINDDNSVHNKQICLRSLYATRMCIKSCELFKLAKRWDETADINICFDGA